MTKAKAKSQTRPQSPGRPCPWDDMEDHSVFTLIEDNTENQVNGPAGEDMYPASPLEIRVMQIENALARVMNFLEQNHAAQQPELHGEDPSAQVFKPVGTPATQVRTA